MEILDVVDETGTPTGETVDRAEAHREGDGTAHPMSGLPATGTDGFSFYYRRDVCRKIHFRAAMYFQCRTYTGRGGVYSFGNSGVERRIECDSAGVGPDLLRTGA